MIYRDFRYPRFDVFDAPNNSLSVGNIGGQHEFSQQLRA